MKCKCSRIELSFRNALDTNRKEWHLNWDSKYAFYKNCVGKKIKIRFPLIFIYTHSNNNDQIRRYSILHMFARMTTAFIHFLSVAKRLADSRIEF